MNKRKRTGRIALALLISGIVFLTNTIAMLLTIVAIYGLARLRVIETTGGQVGLPELLRFFFYTSLVIGFLLASLTGKIILKPIKRIIDQLDRLASGDFKTRLHFGKPIADHPTFKQVEKSFNRAAEELDYTEMLRSDFINNFSRVENQTILTEVARFNLSEQIRGAVLLLAEKWTPKNLYMDMQFGEHMICANEELLKQVWINLLDNAIKFSDPNGTVSVDISDGSECLSISVSNHGKDIPKDRIAHIFNKFYQADESHSSEGNGIGLAVVKKVCELHGGAVSAKSESGTTTFTVVLPKQQNM